MRCWVGSPRATWRSTRLATACSPTGRLLDRHARRLDRPTVDRAGEGLALYGAIARALPELLAETHAQLDALDLARPATRYDTLCRLNHARGLLHDIDDQAVPLAALARDCGMSRSQLLRRFQACFGATPASYHRRLRLERAAPELAAGRLSCSAAAQRFGFAAGSSFSHAFRRTFGRAPRGRG